MGGILRLPNYFADSFPPPIRVIILSETRETKSSLTLPGDEKEESTLLESLNFFEKSIFF